MPLIRTRRNAFNAGELSPAILGRSDIPAYHAGATSIRDWIPTRPGGLVRRPGTVVLGTARNHARKLFLRSFRFAEDDTLTLELSEGAMRVYDEGLVLFARHPVSGAAAVDIATNEIVIDPAHGYVEDLVVRVAPIGAGALPAGLAAATDYTVRKPATLTLVQSAGTVDLPSDVLTFGAHDLVANMGPFRVTSTGTLPGGLSRTTDYYIRAPGATTLQLSLTPGGAAVNINTSVGVGSLTLYPVAAYARTTLRLEQAGILVNITSVGSGLFEIFTPNDEPFRLEGMPWSEEEIPLLQFSGQKDVVYITHQDYELRRLVRYSDAAWELEKPELLDGPYLRLQELYPNEVPNVDITIAPAATTGSNVQVTASSPIFLGSDVGRPIRLGTNADDNQWGWGVIVGVAPLVFTDFDVRAHAATACDSGANTITIPLHTFFNGEGPVRADRDGFGVFDFTNYFVHVIDPNTVSLHTTQADALANVNPVNITGGFTAMNFTSGTIEVAAHGLVEGEGPLTLSSIGVLPSGFSSSAVYYARVWDANSFALSLTPGGEPVHCNFPNGSGVHQVNGTTGASTTATMDIRSDLPAALPTTQWRLGALGSDPRLGGPGAVTFLEQRLILAGSRGGPQVVFGSVTGDPLNFAPDEDDPAGAGLDRIVTTASAFVFELTSEDLNAIGWIREVRSLLGGTLGGVFALGGSTLNDALTIESVNGRRGTTVGAIRRTPVVIANSVIFIDDSGRFLIRAEFRPDVEAIETENLNDLADHLGQAGRFVELARTENPQPIIWVLRDDGVVLSLTFDPRQQVRAWAVQRIGGPDAFVESITVKQGVDGGELRLAVRRTISGSDFRTVERLSSFLSLYDDPDLHQTLDAGVAAYDGAPVTVLTGLEHAEGELLTVVADGEEVADQFVTGGQITLATAASKIVLGFPYFPECEMPVEEIDEATSTQNIANSVQHPSKANVRVLRTRSLEVGVGGNFEEVITRDPDDPMDEVPAVRTGVFPVPIDTSADYDVRVVFRAYRPHPAHVLSMNLFTWASL